MAVDVRGLTASDTEKLDVWFKFACSKIEVTTWNMRQNDYDTTDISYELHIIDLCYDLISRIKRGKYWTVSELYEDDAFERFIDDVMMIESKYEMVDYLVGFLGVDEGSAEDIADDVFKS